MRIAQVSPLYESVPPRLYGGTERVVSWLTEERVRLGHDVTLFASGDSVTAARLIACSDQGLRLDRHCVDPLVHHMLMMEKVFDRIDDFDIVHFHCDYLHFPWTRRSGEANLTTLHGRLDLVDLPPLYEEFDDMPVVSISDAQRTPLPWLNWQGTVHHGMPVDAYPYRASAGEHFAFLGRVSPEKGLDRAIDIAGRLGRKLRVAAKIERTDRDYFDAVIKPLFRLPHVEFIGEIGERDKGEFLGSARALLFPIDWPEPFGLVMMESMACGTPVVALRRGSVSEVIDDGRSGFICDDLDDLVAAAERIDELDRATCREAFERRFSAARMAADYLTLYQRQLEARVHDGRRDRGRQTVLHPGFGAAD
jgi:glycosyltransferase involved in cell wall biosynthesis